MKKRNKLSFLFFSSISFANKLLGAGTHPGGGVMGAAGRNCAKIILGDLKIPQKF